MKERIKIGIVGYGGRGKGLTSAVILPMTDKDVEVVAVCDLYEDRAKEAAADVLQKAGKEPFCTTDYRELVAIPDMDAVMILSAWESHIPVAIAAMESGKWVGMEVGGAYSLEDCWQLVHTSEKTGMPCMLLENCCYGRRELMVLNMVKQGLFGDIMHCAGGYCHDLRSEIAGGKENRHYRLRNYLNRNCENYPTHEIGPIAKVLDINRGNRMLSLTSMASAAKGMHEYIVQNKGENDPLAAVDFAQGDIVTTTIRCAQGQTITITLDTTLPRYYSRGFTVRGTKGMYVEENDSVFLDGKHNECDWEWKNQWGNSKEYMEEYDHPLWKEFNKEVRGGHDGMDWLVFRAFFESVKHGTQPPIDVYDTALYMSLSALSEKSISLGGMPVEIPDFTCGKWTERTSETENWFSLHTICDKPIGCLY